MIKGILGYIWKAYFFLIVLFTIILFYPIFLVVLMQEKYFSIGFKCVRLQAKIILLLIGIRRIEFGEFPKDNRSYIICSNHSSYLDILLLSASISSYFVFLGKKELGSVPLFNIYFKRMNILIDRGNPKASHNAINKAIQEMEKGSSVVIFPEGTISNTVPVMKPFKNGAFKVAIENKIPILPISFPRNYLLLQDTWTIDSKCGPGLAEIHFHKPIEPSSKDYQDLITLRERTREIIQSKLLDGSR